MVFWMNVAAVLSVYDMIWYSFICPAVGKFKKSEPTRPIKANKQLFGCLFNFKQRQNYVKCVVFHVTEGAVLQYKVNICWDLQALFIERVK